VRVAIPHGTMLHAAIVQKAIESRLM